jgi:hypothetical protein
VVSIIGRERHIAFWNPDARILEKFLALKFVKSCHGNILSKLTLLREPDFLSTNIEGFFLKGERGSGF